MQPAQALIEQLSRSIWNVSEAAYRLGVPISEDTITDLIALKIELARLPEVRISRARRIDEATKGFDWEWWVGSNRAGWITYSVQSKRLYVPKNRYRAFRHEVKGQFQIDLLENHAQRNGSIPLYCFYNWIDPRVAGKYWNCSAASDVPLLGCSIAPLTVARQFHALHTWRSFENLHQYGPVVPWRCLFHMGFAVKSGNVHGPGKALFPPRLKPRVHDSLPEQLRRDPDQPAYAQSERRQLSENYGAKWLVAIEVDEHFLPYA